MKIESKYYMLCERKLSVNLQVRFANHKLFVLNLKSVTER